jgi:putative endonuclease
MHYPGQKMKRKDTGTLGENLANNYLIGRGFQILETNYRCKEGEIDIVAREGECLVFVEVRTKTNRNFGSPEESITSTKKIHLKAAANRYQETHSNLPSSWRIDVIAIELDWSGKAERIELIENAIEGD